MPEVPSIEDLGAEELLKGFEEQEEARVGRLETGPGTTGVWRGVYEKQRERRRRDEHSALNIVLFIVYLLPVVVALFLGFQMDTFYRFVAVWVHEAGHGFFCMAGASIVCALMGTGMELAVTLGPALICLKRRTLWVSGCIFMMCSGMSVWHAGLYMQSALDPMGTSFAGYLTGDYNDMTSATHDWSIVFHDLGVLDYSVGIGVFFEQLGRSLAIIFFFSSFAAAFSSFLGDEFQRLSNLVGVSALVTLIFFLFTGFGVYAVLFSALLSAPFQQAFFSRILGK